MTEDFLDKDYNPDVSENLYMKWEQGANKFRILQKPIIGYEWWVHEDGSVVVKGEKPVKGNKPVRVPKKKEHPLFRELTVDEFENRKEFWAMPVWNYKKKRVEVLSINQNGIIRTLTFLARDPEWGSPLQYDITVTRTGEGMETEYETVPAPPKPLTEEQKDAWAKAKIDTEVLFEGGDPFAPKGLTSQDVDQIDKALNEEPNF
jgi:hypothetical protein